MTTIATILLSYNRPRMLREALASLKAAGPDQVVLVDDGSDFDAHKLMTDFFAYSFVDAPKMTTAERLVTPRLGRLINQALSLVTADVVTYLCDDDLFHPGWLDAVRAWFDDHPAEHWTRGDWYTFEDGEIPDLNRPCPLDLRMLTTGNFAHRAVCYRDEGIRWNESSVACHDDMFLWDVDRVHNTRAIPHCGAIAGWRRLHAHNALRYTQHAVYNANATELFAKGWLE
jgi:glycosyltransferase involved in cell wall biosynthesis